ncbi:S-layer homology domain-containing protein [Paenibacillus sp. UNCCL117]|uniref:S-layer homology domain-containing protein n=1 Tax=unclassified Paenibacillus TaxID=185978 RepID=UPI00089167D5|nr:MULTISPECIES: S-layer homology domain-containing protein [unclassified Paenibacillus]SDE02926.1 S-layer homology domain-containing protein [Paenibacillus sp. cl123]SFW57308.1 S-layer homology domain-containing protein [Paenibacillus sp. UNCCL117]
MKFSVLQKTAQTTVLMMMLSVLLPVIAFAANGFSVTFQNGTVSGSVYASTYSSVAPSVYMYDKAGNQIGVTTATYSVYDGVYRYNFTVTGLGVYDQIRLKGPVGGEFNVNDAVYQTVYQTYSPGNNNGGGGGWGGGGGSSTTGSETISVGTDGVVNAEQLDNSFDQYDTVVLNLSGTTATIPAKGLESFLTNDKKVLRITNSSGTYVLPLTALRLSDLASKLSTTVTDLNLKVTIAPADTATADAVSQAAGALGGSIVAQPVDFSLVGVGKDNATAAHDFGSTYVSRMLPLTEEVQAFETTGVMYDPSTKKLSFVPTVFSGKEAVLKRNGNSWYAVVKMKKSFSDITGHWAQTNIELLANKLVVDGVTDTSFQPERSITRAEFAALVVRALGLDTTGSASFTDVAAGQWYTGVVGAAARANLVDGYEDGTFRPNATINREELAAMVVRALDYAKAKPSVNPGREQELLAPFKDAGTIVWAQNELAVAIEAGIIDGMTDDTLGARNDATRAQSATMLKRLLQRANFIN